MARHEFSLAKLNLLNNGEVDEQFIALQKLLLKDCEDRPFIGKARAMSIKITYMPVIAEGSGVLDDVMVRCEFTPPSLPKFASRSYNMKPNAAGKLIFNDNAPEGPQQGTLDELARTKQRADASKHIKPDEGSDPRD